jgi:hypothetical protein
MGVNLCNKWLFIDLLNSLILENNINILITFKITYIEQYLG